VEAPAEAVDVIEQSSGSADDHAAAASAPAVN
jgi:hypothetical protein